jgi:hypothetical protein
MPATPAQPASDGAQVARLLRAIAEEIERDPALAERVAAHLPGSESAEKAIPETVAPDTIEAAPITAVEATIMPEPTPPVLRHGRRSSRFGPPTISGRGRELGTGTPDPFALFASQGEEGLLAALQTLRTGTLRAIIRTHALDPSEKIPPSATEKRLITAIIAAVKRASKPAPKRATKS